MVAFLVGIWTAVVFGYLLRLVALGLGELDLSEGIKDFLYQIGSFLIVAGVGVISLTAFVIVVVKSVRWAWGA